MTTGYKEFTRLNELMDKVNKLEDLYETAEAEDDRWTMNQCILELAEINKEVDELEKEHWYNIHMTDDARYSIVFHTDEDFNKALEMTKILLPNDIDVPGIEMFWTEEWWRDQAVHELDQVGILVDTFTL